MAMLQQQGAEDATAQLQEDDDEKALEALLPAHTECVWKLGR